MNDESQTHTYKLDADVEPEEFVADLVGIQQYKKKPYFKSEDPVDWKVSRQLTADSFAASVIDNDKDQAVYFYSDNCHGCKQFGKFYEHLAIENLVVPRASEIEFSRINNSLNHLGPHIKNFLYTPVFSLFKRKHKHSPPYVYKQQYMTGKSLRDFYEATHLMEPISSEQESDLFSDRQVAKRKVARLKDQLSA